VCSSLLGPGSARPCELLEALGGLVELGNGRLEGALEGAHGVLEARGGGDVGGFMLSLLLRLVAREAQGLDAEVRVGRLSREVDGVGRLLLALWEEPNGREGLDATVEGCDTADGGAAPDGGAQEECDGNKNDPIFSGNAVASFKALSLNLCAASNVAIFWCVRVHACTYVVRESVSHITLQGWLDKVTEVTFSHFTYVKGLKCAMNHAQSQTHNTHGCSRDVRSSGCVEEECHR
jgi:hypothetical protein